MPFHGPASTVALGALTPAERIAAVADRGSVRSVDASLDAPRPSPHLARWGIAAQDDDGIVVARATIDSAHVFFAAQDERFLGGSAGANHADALRRLFELGRAERPAAVVLLAASGGVRLHEANPAEWALARALAALLDLRAAGVPVLVVGVGDVFGGASVLACAAARTALLPGVRLGLSGPAVIETARGRNELDARRSATVARVFGAERARLPVTSNCSPTAPTRVRRLIARGHRRVDFAGAWVQAMQVRLGARLADDFRAGTPANRSGPTGGGRPSLPSLPQNLASLYAIAAPVDPAGWLSRLPDGRTWLCRPLGSGSFGPVEAHALDASLLANFAVGGSDPAPTLLLLGDSAGHEVSLRAEALCVSQYLAQHAAVLALLRARGVRLVGFSRVSATARNSSRMCCRRRRSARSRTHGSSRWSPPRSLASPAFRNASSRR